MAKDITVCAEFKTGQGSQPELAVRQVVGDQGEALTNSPQVAVFESSNWLEAKTSVSLADDSTLAEINSAQAPKRAVLADLEGFCLS